MEQLLETDFLTLPMLLHYRRKIRGLVRFLRICKRADRHERVRHIPHHAIMELPSRRASSVRGGKVISAGLRHAKNVAAIKRKSLRSVAWLI